MFTASAISLTDFIKSSVTFGWLKGGYDLTQGGPNPGPRATSGPRQHFLWPAEDSAKILEKLRESLSEI